MKAVLDACVLYPTVLREILQGAAAAGLYEPVVVVMAAAAVASAVVVTNQLAFG